MQKIHGPFVFLAPVPRKKQDLYGEALKVDARSRGGTCLRHRPQIQTHGMQKGLDVGSHSLQDHLAQHAYGPSLPKEKINK